VSYNDKHNEENGEDGSDGTSDNRSWNSGVEGPTKDPDILSLRERQMRNFLASLLMSQGTPMITAGDEFARTQGGNNNAFCQDNEIGWIDWKLCKKNDALVRFVRKIALLRHRYPILRRNLFLNGQYDEELGLRDVTWVNSGGQQMSEEDWNHPDLRCFGMLLDGRAPTTGLRQRGEEATILIAINGNPDVVAFELPDCVGSCGWQTLVDTNWTDSEVDPSVLRVGEKYLVTGRSLVALVLKTA
jgi:glycogen operon protein